jgi:hypothetical protein
MNQVNRNNIYNNNIGIYIPNSDNNVGENNFSNNIVDIDEAFITPGFELILIFISIAVLVCFKFLKNKKIE